MAGRFEVCEVGSGVRLGVYTVAGPLEALDAYSDEQGFAAYADPASTDADAITPTVHDDGTASAPFTNYEIVARPTDDG